MKGISNLCFADDIGMINVFIAFYFYCFLELMVMMHGKFCGFRIYARFTKSVYVNRC